MQRKKNCLKKLSIANSQIFDKELVLFKCWHYIFHSNQSAGVIL